MSAQQEAERLWQREVPSGSWNVRHLRRGIFEVTADDGAVVGVVDVDGGGSVMHMLADAQLARLQHTARLLNPVATALIFEGRMRVRCTCCGCTSWLPVDYHAANVQAAFLIGARIGTCRGCDKELTVAR